MLFLGQLAGRVQRGLLGIHMPSVDGIIVGKFVVTLLLHDEIAALDVLANCFRRGVDKGSNVQNRLLTIVRDAFRELRQKAR